MPRSKYLCKKEGSYHVVAMCSDGGMRTFSMRSFCCRASELHWVPGGWCDVIQEGGGGGGYRYENELDFLRLEELRDVQHAYVFCFLHEDEEVLVEDIEETKKPRKLLLWSTALEVYAIVPFFEGTREVINERGRFNRWMSHWTQ